MNSIDFTSELTDTRTVSRSQLDQFKLHFETTEVGLEIWERAGKQLRERYKQQIRQIISLYLIIRKRKN